MGLPHWRVHTATLVGIEAIPVDVEVDFSAGIPGMTIVGMPNTQILEARSRVRCAMRACGFELPRLHVTINLKPGDVKKTGTGFDLPLAVGMLAAAGQIPIDHLDECLFLGELGLAGEVSCIRGEMAYALLAQSLGLTLAGAVDPAIAHTVGCHFVDVRSLGELRNPLDAFLDQDRTTSRPNAVRLIKEKELITPTLDYGDVIDQEQAKRAFVIAAAGGHGLLMTGPPGAGKTMLARRLPSILPPLEGTHRLEAALIHSVAGEDVQNILKGERPLRAPHHSVSPVGLVGGGRPVTPGEVSLAHEGVLFLDELPEFANNALQSLRQPIEDGVVRIVRAEGTFQFPSRFQLVAAANPCPCGHLGDPGHHCTCSPERIVKYQGRVGGPLMDRIDLTIDVARPSSHAIVRGSVGASSKTMREAVLAAREFCQARTQKRAHESKTGPLDKYFFSEEALTYLEQFARRLCLGGRAVTKIASIARTVADLERHERVCAGDVAEAAAYRSRGEMEAHGRAA